MNYDGSKQQRENWKKGGTIEREANWESPGNYGGKAQRRNGGKRRGNRGKSGKMVLTGDREENMQRG